jgi:ferredoxin
MRVRIEQERCTGHGRCYSVAPGLLEADDEGYGQVIGDGQVAADEEQAARLARDSCPEQAVQLTDS